MDAAEWDARYTQSELVWGAPPNSTVVEYVHGLDKRTPLQPDVSGGDPPSMPRALDLGCGEGRHAMWLATHGWQVRAVDFSQVGIDKGRTAASRLSRSVRERITWQCLDVTSPDVTSLDVTSPDAAATEDTTDPATAGLTGPFELILLAYLHLESEQRRTLLRGLVGLLSPGATLLVLGHDTTNLTEGHGGPQEPSILFTPSDIMADLGEASGDIGIRVADRVVRPTEQGDAIDALVVATRTIPDLERQAVDADPAAS